MSYKTIQDVKGANLAWSRKNEREYWFNTGAMNFFDTKVIDKVYGGRFFITSEQYLATPAGKQDFGDKDGERKFSIRLCEKSGQIDTVGENMEYSSLGVAHQAIEEVLLMHEKYLHTPPIPGYGHVLMLLECSDRNLRKSLELLSIDGGKKRTFYLMLSKAPVMVLEFDENRFGPAKFHLVTQGYREVEDRSKINLSNER